MSNFVLISDLIILYHFPAGIATSWRGNFSGAVGGVLRVASAGAACFGLRGVAALAWGWRGLRGCWGCGCFGLRGVLGAEEAGCWGFSLRGWLEFRLGGCWGWKAAYWGFGSGTGRGCGWWLEGAPASACELAAGRGVCLLRLGGVAASALAQGGGTADG